MNEPTELSVAMLLHKSVEHDSRVRREAAALQWAGHEVTVVHLPSPDSDWKDGFLEGFAVRSASPPAQVRRFLPFHAYRLVFLVAFIRRVRELEPDLVHAHDAAMLAPGLIAARSTGARLIYDSHEYATGVAYRGRGWAMFVRLLEGYVIRRCTATITVSDGVADRLTARYQLSARPTVIKNLPDLAAQQPAVDPPSLRAALGIGESPLILHQGAVAPGRGCLSLVAALAHRADTHLVFLGGAGGTTAGEVVRAAKRLGVSGRVHLTAPVPVRELHAYTREADVGVSLLEDTCENHRLALPNKIFDYLAAGLSVVASDLPEVRRAFGESPRFLLTDPMDPRAIADCLDAALELPPLAETNAQISWDTEKTRLLSLYSALAGAER